MVVVSMGEVFGAPVALQFDARPAMFSSVSEGHVIDHQGRHVAAVRRHGGLVGVTVGVHLPPSDDTARIVATKAGLGTGSWTLTGAFGEPLGWIKHAWFTSRWDAQVNHLTASVHASRWGRPVGGIEVDGHRIASLERLSMWSTGLFSRKRSWRVTTTRALSDDEATVVLVAPIVLDLRERSQDSGAGGTE